jgi:hypothetical protein
MRNFAPALLTARAWRHLDRAAALLEQRSEELVRVLDRGSDFQPAMVWSEVRRCETFACPPREARNLRGDMVPLEGAPSRPVVWVSRCGCRWAWCARSRRSTRR